MLDSGRFDGLIQKDISDATAAGVTGTPTFVIGGAPSSSGTVEGSMLIGAQPFEAFDRKLQQVLAQPSGSAK